MKYIYILFFATVLFTSCSIGVDLEPDPAEEGTVKSVPQKMTEGNQSENMSNIENNINQ